MNGCMRRMMIVNVSLLRCFLVDKCVDECMICYEYLPKENSIIQHKIKLNKLNQPIYGFRTVGWSEPNGFGSHYLKCI